MIADVIAEFRRQHAGESPQSIIVSPGAAVLLSSKVQLPTSYDGVLVRVVTSGFASVAPGRGTSVAIVLARLPGDVVAAVAHEC